MKVKMAKQKENGNNKVKKYSINSTEQLWPKHFQSMKLTIIPLNGPKIKNRQN